MQFRSRFLAWTSWFVLGAAIVLTAAVVISIPLVVLVWVE